MEDPIGKKIICCVASFNGHAASLIETATSSALLAKGAKLSDSPHKARAEELANRFAKANEDMKALNKEIEDFNAEIF